MATGGVFNLIANSGKQDRMLMASELLKDRLDDATKLRRQAGKTDTTPTLLDIEQTHILFVNAHFKPFAAMAFEYSKVNPDSGASLNSDVRFSIPQFGDFFNDMAFYCKFKPLSYSPTVTAPNQDVFRYADFPGERLLKKVKFDVNGNPLDEYTSDVYNFHRQFYVTEDKLVSWKRMVGQEVPQEAYLRQQTTTQPSSRVRMEYLDGFQTPKGSHDALTVMVPLLFWFNKDPRLSIPSVAIPYGQRFITLTLASSEELVELVTPPGASGSDEGVLPTLAIDSCCLLINNIFVNPEVHSIFIKRIGFSLVRVHRIQRNRVDKDTDNVLLNNLKWPIEYMFVGLRPTENVSMKPQPDNVSLQRWHKFSKVSETVEELSGVSSSKVDSTAAAEVSAFLLVADLGLGDTPANQFADYASLPRTTKIANDLFATAFAATGIAGATAQDVYTAVQAASSATYYTQPTLQGASAEMEVHRDMSTINTLKMSAHGIDIYKSFPGMFYNAYLPYTYGGSNMTSPKDIGAHLITLCLYPNVHQPSGHLNVSRARELYLEYDSAGMVSSSSPADLVVVASAINFLLISDGSAVLRYST